VGHRQNLVGAGVEGGGAMSFSTSFTQNKFFGALN